MLSLEHISLVRIHQFTQMSCLSHGVTAVHGHPEQGLSFLSLLKHTTVSLYSHPVFDLPCYFEMINYYV